MFSSTFALESFLVFDVKLLQGEYQRFARSLYISFVTISVQSLWWLLSGTLVLSFPIYNSDSESHKIFDILWIAFCNNISSLLDLQHQG